METIYAAIAIFGITASIGLYLLSLVLRDKQTPKAGAFVHGMLAVTGLILLIVYSTGHEVNPVASIILFSVTAMGGIVLLYKDLRGSVPKVLAIAHGIIAIASFVLLLVFAFA